MFKIVIQHFIIIKTEGKWSLIRPTLIIRSKYWADRKLASEKSISTRNFFLLVIIHNSPNYSIIINWQKCPIRIGFKETTRLFVQYNNVLKVSDPEPVVIFLLVSLKCRIFLLHFSSINFLIFPFLTFRVSLIPVALRGVARKEAAHQVIYSFRARENSEL